MIKESYLHGWSLTYMSGVLLTWVEYYSHGWSLTYMGGVLLT